MAYYNYDEWVKRLTDNMSEVLSKQIIDGCKNIRSHEGGFSLFKQRVMNEFTDKYHIIQVALNDLSDRELTTLLTYGNPLNRVYYQWVSAMAVGMDNQSKFNLLGDVIDELAESRLNYVIDNYDALDKGDRTLYFDRIMMSTGQMDYDSTGDVVSENDPSRYDEAESENEEDLEQ